MVGWLVGCVCARLIVSILDYCRLPYPFFRARAHTPTHPSASKIFFQAANYGVCRRLYACTSTIYCMLSDFPRACVYVVCYCRFVASALYVTGPYRLHLPMSYTTYGIGSQKIRIYLPLDLSVSHDASARTINTKTRCRRAFICRAKGSHSGSARYA